MISISNNAFLFQAAIQSRGGGGDAGGGGRGGLLVSSIFLSYRLDDDSKFSHALANLFNQIQGCYSSARRGRVRALDFE